MSLTCHAPWGQTEYLHSFYFGGRDGHSELDTYCRKYCYFSLELRQTSIFYKWSVNLEGETKPDYMLSHTMTGQEV